MENAYNDLAAKTAKRQAEAEAVRRKRETDLGISSQTLTLQNQAEMAAKANLGDISRQKQAQTEFNQAMARQSQLGLEAQQTSAQAQQSFLESQSATALESIRGFGEQALLQQQQLSDISLTQQNALQALDVNLAKAEYAIDDTNREREMYYNLYLKGKMSASQFQSKTGIAVKAFSTGRKKSTSLLSAAKGIVQNESAQAADQSARIKAAQAEAQKNRGRLTETEYQSEQSVSENIRSNPEPVTYRQVLDNVTTNQIAYVSEYGSTEYNRVVTYLQFRADASENGIDLSYFAPFYLQYIDIVENKDAYVDAYGTAGYNAIYNSVYATMKDQIAAVYDAIDLKNSDSYTSDVLSFSPSLASKYKYADDPEDQARLHLGLVPMALEKDAQDIIDKYKELSGDISIETGSFTWDTADVGNATPTMDDLVEAVKYLEWEDHYNNMSIADRATFDSLSLEDQTSTKNQYFTSNQIRSQAEQLSPDDLSTLAQAIGLPSNSTVDDIVQYFVDRQAEIDQSRVDLGLPEDATEEDVRNAQLRKLGDGLGLSPTASNAEIMAEYENYQADPIAWTNQFYDNKDLSKEESNLESLREQSIVGAKELGQSQEDIDRINAYYDDQIKELYVKKEADRNAALKAIDTAQEIDGFDVYKSNADFQTVASEQLAKWSGAADQTTLAYMSNDQKNMYAYLYATDKAKANEYMDLIDDYINSNIGKKLANDLSDHPVLNKVFGAIAGVENFFTGVAQWFTDKEIEPSGLQYASSYLMDKMGGADKFIYELSYAAGNMAPSIIASYLTGGALSGTALAQTTAGIKTIKSISGAVGSTLLGTSAGGNAYGEALRLGYTQEQAKAYGILTGASEGGLQFLLGGIGQLGGSTERIARIVSGVDNTFRRVGLKLVGQMGSEALEEYLQAVIEPILRNSILGENNEISLFGVDKLRAAAMGAIMALGFSGFGISTYKDDVKSQLISGVLEKAAADLPDGDPTKAVLLNAAEDIKTNGTDAPLNIPQDVLSQAALSAQPDAEIDSGASDGSTQAVAESMASVADISSTKATANLQSQLLNVTTSRNGDVINAIDSLTNIQKALLENGGLFANLSNVNLNTAGLTEGEINTLSKILNSDGNINAKIKKYMNDLNQRVNKDMNKVIDKTRKVISYLSKHAMAETQSAIDALSTKYDTKARVMEDTIRTKARSSLLSYITEYGSVDDIPTALLQGILRGSKISLGDLTYDELLRVSGEVSTLKQQNDFYRSEVKAAREAVANENLKLAQDTIPKNKKFGLFGTGFLPTVAKYFSSPSTIMKSLGVDLYNKVFEKIQMSQISVSTNNWFVGNIMSEFSEKYGKLFNDSRGFASKETTYDPSLNMDLTKAQILALHLNALDKDGYWRLVNKNGDGFVIVNEKSQTDVMYLEESQVIDFLNNFEERYPEIKEAEGYLRDIISYYVPLVNDVSRKLHGYDLITETDMLRNPNYWTNVVRKAIDITSENRGLRHGDPFFTKERHGGGVMEIINPLWVVNHYHRAANNYVSFAESINDASNLLNTEYMQSVLASMGVENGRSVLGDWFEGYLKDTLNGRTVGYEIDNNIINAITLYNKSKITWNLKVVGAQTASYFCAQMFIDLRYLKSEKVFRKAKEVWFDKEARAKFLKNVPVLYERLMKGHSMIEAGEGINGWLNDVFSAKGVRYADFMTVATIYFAAQEQALHTASGDRANAELTFYRALFNTQPMFDAPFRSEFQKSIGGKLFGAFTTQIFQQWNMLQQSSQYIQFANDLESRAMTDTENAETYRSQAKEYRKTAINAIAGVGESVVMFSTLKWALSMLLPGWTGRDDKERKEAQSWWGQFGSSAISTLFPVISPLISLGVNKITGSELPDYGFSIPLTDVLDAAYTAITKIGSDDYTFYGQIVDMAKIISEANGIPFGTIEKYVTETLEEIIPDFEYDYIKKEPNATTLAKDYIYSGSSLPDMLPTTRDVVYNSYWDVIKDGTISGKETDIVNRIRTLSSAISTTQINPNDMYGLMRDRAVKEVFDSDEITAIKKLLSDNKMSVTIANVNSAAERLGYKGRITLTDVDLSDLVKQYYK